MKVYLAGGFYSDWRQEIQRALPQLETFDPEHDNDQSASYRFVRDDIEAIEAADLVIAYYGGGHPSHGMAAEIGYAAALKKPVYYIDTTGVPDLFLVGLSKRTFAGIGHFTDWWKRREGRGLPLP